MANSPVVPSGASEPSESTTMAWHPPRGVPMATKSRPAVIAASQEKTCARQKTVASVGPYRLKIFVFGAASCHRSAAVCGKASPPNTVIRKSGKLPGCKALICCSMPAREGTEFHTVSCSLRANLTAFMTKFAGRI